MDRSEMDRILSFVEKTESDQLGFVISLCNQNSYTYNPEGTNRVAEMVLSQLDGIFASHEVAEQTEVGHHHILRTQGAVRPVDSASIYLLGHMDTVFPPDHAFQSCSRDGEWLTGPGTGDMKGGLAVIVYALKALEAARLMDRLNIAIILSADEETGAATSRSIYEQEVRRAGLCLVAECAGSRGEVVASRNGKSGLRLDCFGEERHVGRVSGGKSSAILEIAHKIVELEGLNDSYPGVTVNVGQIDGGLGPCTVPGRASCLLDMRWLEERHHEGLLENARSIVETRVQPGCRCQLTVLNHRPAMPLTEATEKALVKLESVAETIGLKLGREHRRGTSDANYFGSAGVATIDGFGPVCEDDHTPHERIHIPSLAARTRLLALFLNEYAPIFASAD
jgi:glutamate carboxypeptidase